MLLTITIAFVIKIFKISPETEQHELVNQQFYDWVLMITLILCLPFAFAVTLVAKYREFPASLSDLSLCTTHGQDHDGTHCYLPTFLLRETSRR